MKSRIILSLLLLLALSASAATRVSLDIEVTNNPATGNKLVVNSSTKTWTNAASSSTIATNSAGTITAAATNLFNALSQYPYAGPLTLGWVRSNVVRLTAEVNGPLVPSAVGNWATLTLDTNPVAPLKSMQWPWSSIVYPSNRINQASDTINGLSDFGATSFGTNCVALSNYVSRGAIEQSIWGTKRHLGTNFFWHVILTNATLLGGSISGNLGWVTNGYLTNTILENATLTNATLIGGTLSGSFVGGYLTNTYAESLTVTNLSVPGTGANSVRVGTDSTASGSGSTAVGQNANAGAHSASAFGYFASAYGTNAVAIGQGADVAGNEAVGIGQNTSVFAVGGVTLGRNTTVAQNHTNSVAIGNAAATTKTNQVYLGSSSHIVTVPGVFEAAAVTNAYLRGTNVLSGSLAARRADHTSMVNGDNAGVIFGTNYFIRIVAGPTAAFTIHGLANGQDGQKYEVVNYTGFPMTLANNSGTEPTAGNRILTGTGASVVVTNYPGSVNVIYDSAAAKWVLKERTD